MRLRSARVHRVHLHHVPRSCLASELEYQLVLNLVGTMSRQRSHNQLARNPGSTVLALNRNDCMKLQNWIMRHCDPPSPQCSLPSRALDPRRLIRLFPPDNWLRPNIWRPDNRCSAFSHLSAPWILALSNRDPLLPSAPYNLLLHNRLV
jgi:hypothetical protein